MDKFDKAIEFLQEKQRSLKCAHMLKSMDGEATEKDIDEYREEFALYRLALTALKQQQERVGSNIAEVGIAVAVQITAPKCAGEI